MNQVYTATENTTSLAKTLGVPAKLVHATYLKAHSEDLREVRNAAGALALFMIHQVGLVSAEREAAMKVSVMLGIMAGDFGPDVDLSELADEVEAKTSLVH